MSEGNTDKAVEQHGGDLSWIAARYSHATRPLIDLSTGINPYAYPLPDLEPEWFHRLADSAELAEAHMAAAQYYRAGNPESITLAAGMQPLLFALAALRLKEYGASDIAVLSPTYGEHQRVWQAMGHRISFLTSLQKVSGGVVIACNPNNPDGRVIPPASLLQLAQELAALDGWLIVDESFADLNPKLSIATAAQQQPNIAVLRSCGKFFGAAGLRVSAAVAPATWTQWLRVATGPWPLSTPACRLLPAMLQDAAWIGNMRARLEREAADWRGLLSQYFAPVGHTDLFTLVETDHASHWHEYLASQGILVRRFDYNPRWLRFGLPERAQLPRLQTAFAACPKP